jgi:signal transduction histidine kinase/DNA-binding response OmpR family regulator/ligand-binding sensor domain-containing protein
LPFGHPVVSFNIQSLRLFFLYDTGVMNASFQNGFKDCGWRMPGLPVLVFLFLPFFISAQEHGPTNGVFPFESSGFPFVTNYTPDDYGAFNQNWGAVQDSSGILYFANGNGVLMYDGSGWDLVPLPNRTHVKSITIDADNTIFVGGTGEFGYLRPDRNGRIRYISLLPMLNEEDRAFSTVWECIATDGGVYFKTNEALFRWSGEEFTIWREPGLRRLFLTEETVFTIKSGEGIHFIDPADSILLFSGGDQFAQETVTLILPFGSDELLVGTYSNGLFLLKDGKKEPFVVTGLNLSDQKLYTGTDLNDQTYALGFLSGGIVVVSHTGKVVLHLESPDPLVSGIVHHLYRDRQGMLWASLNDGISRVEYPSPFNTFGLHSGIPGRIQLVGRYGEEILAGTDVGLYHLDRDGTAVHPEFSLYRGISDQVWDVLEFEGSLLLALRDGVYKADEDITQLGNWSPSAFLRSGIDPNRLFISQANGLRSIYLDGNNWKDEGVVEGILGSVYTMLEMDSGNLWLETSENWLWRIVFETGRNRPDHPDIKKYGVDHGLPGETGNIFSIDNRLYFTSGTSLKTYVFDQGSDLFVPAFDLSQILEVREGTIALHHVDTSENIWFSSGNGLVPREYYVGWRGHDGGYVVEPLKLSRIGNHIGGSGAFFFDPGDSLLWITGKNRVIRYDLQFRSPDPPAPATLLKRVLYQGDSILIQGHYHLLEPEIPFRDNHLRFQFATPVFQEEKATLYQSFLEGFDRKWSSWTPETQRDFTNLPGGRYTFYVRAKSISGTDHRPAQFSFRIVPPWYQTLWAYMIFFTIAIVSVGVFARWRSARLRKEKIALERVVAERTHQLTIQADKLRDLDRMKSRFFANISHEFRTPLTLIKGPVKEIIQKKHGELSIRDARMIEQNTGRLLRLVDQLLDLAGLDAGSLKPEPGPGEINRFLRTLAAAFSSHATRRKIEYLVSVPDSECPASFDHDKLEKIVYNLISNAFKYTPDKGCVSFKANYSEGRLMLRVSDSGRGIPEANLSGIFDRFHHSGIPETEDQGGTGIGLALTRELVTLLGGTVSVRSKEGIGSSFMVELPLEILGHSIEYIVRDPQQSTEPDVHAEVSDLPESDGSGHDQSSLILVVEDHPDMRDYIKSELKGYRLQEATNGREGLGKAIDEIPDLIITDVMMPEMDGNELCRRLKTDERTSHIPVIVLTARAGIENKLEGLETGADDYLTKPFERDELTARVRNLIRQREQLRQYYSRQVFLQPENISVTSIDEQFLTKVMGVLESSFHDEQFGVPKMQDALAMSKTQLHRKMKALTGRAPGEFLREFRLQKAAGILAKDAGNVTETAYAVGFGSLSYFTRSFRKLYHLSPSEFAARQRDH